MDAERASLSAERLQLQEAQAAAQARVVKEAHPWHPPLILLPATLPWLTLTTTQAQEEAAEARHRAAMAIRAREVFEEDAARDAKRTQDTLRDLRRANSTLSNEAAETEHRTAEQEARHAQQVQRSEEKAAPEP